MKIAVYGSLKQKYNLKLITSKPLYNGYIKVNRLSGKSFPMIKLGDKYKVQVEVYDVSKEELQKIDDYEGYLKENLEDNFYNRVKTKVYDIETNKAIENVFVYEFNFGIFNNTDKNILLGYKEDSIFNW